MLTVSGALIGLAIAATTVDLVSPLVRSQIGDSQSLHLNWLAAVFSIVLAIGTGLVSAVFPAIRAVRFNPACILREVNSTASQRKIRFRQVLTSVQVCIAFILLVSSIALIQGVVALITSDIGIEPNHVVLTKVSPPQLIGATSVTQFYSNLLQQIESIPQVSSTAIINDVPLAGTDKTGTFVLEGQPAFKSGQEDVVSYRLISPSYFDTLGIPMVRGSGFGNHDLISNTRVAIVNKAMADRLIVKRDPVGVRIKLEGLDHDANWLTIIGVVGNVRHSGPGIPPRPEVYVPFTQHSPESVEEYSLLIKGSGDTGAISAVAREQLRKAAPMMPIRFETMQQYVDRASAAQKLQTYIFVLFTLLATVTAGFSVYSLTAHSLLQRRRELGIREALGATRTEIGRIVCLQGAIPVALGVLSGILPAWGAVQLAVSPVSSTSTSPAASVIVALGTMVVVTIAALFVPIRQAADLQLAQILRQE